MVYIEEKAEIEASAETVFNILNKNIDYPRWNKVIDESKKLGEGRFLIKSSIGEYTVIRKDVVLNESLTFIHEGSPFSEVGETITLKGNGVEVILWGEVKDESKIDMLIKPMKLFIESLKVYAEFLESGGIPEEFNKSELVAIQ
ncbi:MAG: hypothetical protein ACFFD7_12180 [Candidatus Thorarchaeota archaeon]